MTGLAALSAGKVAGSFVLSNWKWLLPAAAFVALGAWAADRTVRVANLRAEIAQGEADRANAVLAQKEKDRLLGIAVSAELADANARAKATVTTRTEVIYREKVVIPSVDTPAMRDADDGLFALGFRRATRPAASGPDGAAATP